MQRIVKRTIIPAGQGKVRKAGNGTRIARDSRGNLYAVKPMANAGGAADREIARRQQAASKSPNTISSTVRPTVDNQKQSGYSSFLTDYLLPGVAYVVGAPMRMGNAIGTTIVAPVMEAIANQKKEDMYSNYKYGNTHELVGEAWKHVLDPSAPGPGGWNDNGTADQYGRLLGLSGQYAQDAINRRIEDDYQTVENEWQQRGYDFHIDRQNGKLVDSNGVVRLENPIEDYLEYKQSGAQQGQGKKKTTTKRRSSSLKLKRSKRTSHSAKKDVRANARQSKKKSIR